MKSSLNTHNGDTLMYSHIIQGKKKKEKAAEEHAESVFAKE